MGFAWSVPVSSKENCLTTGRKQTGGGGKRIIGGGGSKTVFGKGFYGMFSPPLSFPPPIVSLKYRKTLPGLFFCSFLNGAIAQTSCDILQNGVSHRCAYVKLSTTGGSRIMLGEC